MISALGTYSVYLKGKRKKALIEDESYEDGFSVSFMWLGGCSGLPLLSGANKTGDIIGDLTFLSHDSRGWPWSVNANRTNKSLVTS